MSKKTIPAERYLSCADKITRQLYITNFNDKEDVEMLEYFLYDACFHKFLKSVRSGYITVEANELYKTGTPLKNLCNEHQYPRMRCARDIIKLFREDKLTRKRLLLLLHRVTQVHITTKKENQKIRPFQQDYSIPRKEHYSLAGIEGLLPFVEPKDKQIVAKRRREARVNIKKRNKKAKQIGIIS